MIHLTKLVPKLTQCIIVLALVAIGFLLRILPHPANVAPITAIALLGGAKLPRSLAVLVPLVTMMISDYFIGFHGTIAYTWGSFALIALLSNRFMQNNSSILRLGGLTLTSSFLFFLITNFGVWAEGTMYPPTLNGLLQSYIMGIPFYRNTIIGDVLFTGLFFGAYEIVVAATKAFTRSIKVSIS